LIINNDFLSDLIAAQNRGKVMGMASKQLSGKAEGSEIAAKVKELLA
jgi:uncharacterized protein YqeY